MKITLEPNGLLLHEAPGITTVIHRGHPAFSDLIKATGLNPQELAPDDHGCGWPEYQPDDEPDNAFARAEAEEDAEEGERLAKACAARWNAMEAGDDACPVPVSQLEEEASVLEGLGWCVEFTGQQWVARPCSGPEGCYSAGKVLKLSAWIDVDEPIALSTAHAPEGGISIVGKRFEGGQFIPGPILAQASDEERAKIEHKEKHELTRDQFLKTMQQTPEGKGQREALLKQWHEKAVRAAVRGGQTVPAHILEEYPRIKPNKPKEPAAPTTSQRLLKGDVVNMPVESLEVDPERFQFKQNVDKSGVTSEMKEVRQWNPDFAGVLAVWRDPADGKTYVVNGHHRRELAGRLGVKNLAVRYIDAKDAKEARAVGALINIAEGRGTAMDAAKFMRDTGRGPEDMAKEGVSLKGKVSADAVVLTKLSDRLFDKVARGTMPQDQALAIARNLSDHNLQDQLAVFLARREDDGKEYTTKVIEDMAKEMAETPTQHTTEASLFGDIESDESLFGPRNELKTAIRADLSKAVNDFAAVASTRRAAAVGKAGNVLDVEANRRIALESERVRNVFDKLVNRKGAISDALNEGASEYAKAKGRKARDDIREKTVDAVRNAVFAEAGIGNERPGLEPGLPGGPAAPAGGEPAHAEASAPDGGRDSAERGGLTYDEFAKKYRQAFREMSKYTPDQVGSNHFADQMAALADQHPDWAEKVESEVEPEDKPKPAQTAPEEREPWQMSRDEFLGPYQEPYSVKQIQEADKKAKGARSRFTRRTGPMVPPAISGEVSSKISQQEATADDMREAYRAYVDDYKRRATEHYEAVEKAAKSGKPLSPEVLADYPHLAPKAAPITPDTLKSARRAISAGRLSPKGSATSTPIKSALSGLPIRRYVELEDGSKIHPDELARADVDADGNVTLGPEDLTVHDPLNHGPDIQPSFERAVATVAAYGGHDDDPVTIQSPHGYPVKMTRGEWRPIAQQLLDEPEAFAQWYDRENPAAESDAAKNAKATAKPMSDLEQNAFFAPHAEQGRMFQPAALSASEHDVSGEARDADGKWIGGGHKVFHGTSKDFKVPEAGSYWTSNPKAAHVYRHHKEGFIHVGYLAEDANVKDFADQNWNDDDIQAFFEATGKNAQNYQDFTDLIESSKFRNFLRESGYDAIEFNEDSSDAGDDYSVRHNSIVPLTEDAIHHSHRMAAKEPILEPEPEDDEDSDEPAALSAHDVSDEQRDESGQWTKASRASQMATHLSKKAGGTKSLRHARDAEAAQDHREAMLQHGHAAAEHIAEYITNGGDAHLEASMAHAKAGALHQSMLTPMPAALSASEHDVSGEARDDSGKWTASEAKTRRAADEDIAANNSAWQSKIWTMERPNTEHFNDAHQRAVEAHVAKIITRNGQLPLVTTYQNESPQHDPATIFWVNGKQRASVHTKPDESGLFNVTRVSHPMRHGGVHISANDSHEENEARIRKKLGIKPREEPIGLSGYFLDDSQAMAAIALGTAHAPVGGTSIGSKHFEGGQFIPGAVLARATDEELATVVQKEPHELTREEFAATKAAGERAAVIKRWHEKHVREAVKAGKKVPNSVVEQYPALAALRTQRGEKNPASFESAGDSVAGYSERFRDLAERQTFLEHGLRGLDVPSQRIMLRSMLAALHDPKIRDVVVQTVPIDVVNDLAALDPSAEVRLHDGDMLVDHLVIDTGAAVSLRMDLADTLVSSVASATAKQIGRTGHMEGGSENLLPAIGASDLDASAVESPPAIVGAEEPAALVDFGGTRLLPQSSSATGAGDVNHSAIIGDGADEGHVDVLAEQPELTPDDLDQIKDLLHTEQAEATSEAEPEPFAKPSADDGGRDQAEPGGVESADPASDYAKNGTRAKAFKAWFGDWENDAANASKVVNADGEPQETHEISGAGSKVMKDGAPVVVYHGTSHGGFEAFDPSKIASDNLFGPGFYFTEDEAVAKEYQDRGAEWELADLNVPGRNRDTEGAAARELRKRIKARKAELLPAWEQFGPYGAKTDQDKKSVETFRAMQRKLDLSDTALVSMLLEPTGHLPFESSGIKVDDIIKSKHQQEVKALYLNIRKPLDLDGSVSRSEAIEILGPHLEQRLARKSDTDEAGNYNAQDFYNKCVNVYLAQPGAHEQTNKNAVTAALKKAGYDGITHIGGDRQGGGHHHRVWIAFEPSQIKSVANKGTFDPAQDAIALSAFTVSPTVRERALADLRREIERLYGPA